jgi:hypothetical protein
LTTNDPRENTMMLDGATEDETMFIRIRNSWPKGA